MNKLIAWVKSEPVAVATIIGALVTIATALGVGQGEVGIIAGAITIILGALARSQVTPNSKVAWMAVKAKVDGADHV